MHAIFFYLYSTQKIRIYLFPPKKIVKVSRRISIEKFTTHIKAQIAVPPLERNYFTIHIFINPNAVQTIESVLLYLVDLPNSNYFADKDYWLIKFRERNLLGIFLD
jgi:hypothetical protein